MIKFLKIVGFKIMRVTWFKLLQTAGADTFWNTVEIYIAGIFLLVLPVYGYWYNINSEQVLLLKSYSVYNMYTILETEQPPVKVYIHKLYKVLHL